MPSLYAIPGAPAGPGTTFYRGFSGEGTLFDPKVKLGVPIASVTDGNSNTLGVVEAREAIPWTRPDAEIAFDPAMKPEQARRLLESILGSHFPGGFNALFLDGSVRFLKLSISPQVLKALITRNGGEVVSADSF
jgi:prepilin-type processing-associated H-X9-DG protein